MHLAQNYTYLILSLSVIHKGRQNRANNKLMIVKTERASHQYAHATSRFFFNNQAHKLKQLREHRKANSSLLFFPSTHAKSNISVLQSKRQSAQTDLKQGESFKKAHQANNSMRVSCLNVSGLTKLTTKVKAQTARSVNISLYQQEKTERKVEANKATSPVKTHVDRVKEINRIFDKHRGQLLHQRGDKTFRAKRILTIPSHIVCQTISPLSQAMTFINRLPLTPKPQPSEDKLRASSRYKDIPLGQFLYGTEPQEAQTWLKPKYQKRVEHIRRRQSLPRSSKRGRTKN